MQRRQSLFLNVYLFTIGLHGPQVARACLGRPVYLSLITNSLFYISIVVKKSYRKEDRIKRRERKEDSFTLVYKVYGKLGWLE